MKDADKWMKNWILKHAQQLRKVYSVQCHNLIVAEAMEKTLKDAKCEPEIALAWAVSAKNALQNHFGHSLNKLVFSFNINTASVFTDKLSVFKAATTTEMVRINSNVLYAVRKSIMEVESSEKIQKALRSNVRTYVDEGFVKGDTVYYKRQNC